MLSSEVPAGWKTDSWTATPATTSVAASPMTSGDSPKATGTRAGKDRDRHEPRPGDDPEHGVLEEGMPGEEERRPSEDGCDGGHVGLPDRMGDHELVADGGDDDAGHQRQVRVGVRRARDASSIIGSAHRFLARIGTAVEVDPPQRD